MRPRYRVVCLLLICAGIVHGQHWFSAPLALDPARRTQGAADMDGDGDLDLVRVTVSGTSWLSVGVSLNDGAGSFSGGAASPLVVAVTRLIAMGDFDGDGNIDVAVPTSDGTPVTGAGILVLPGDGAGSLGTPVHTALDGNVLAWGVHDVDGDGMMDLAVIHAASGGTGTHVRWFLASGGGTFVAQTGILAPPGLEPRGLALVDLDQDGDLDVSTLVVVPSPLVATFITSGTSVGPGPVAAAPSLASTAPWIRAGDFLGNGAPQLLIAGRAGGTLETSIVTFPGGVVSVGNPRVLGSNLSSDGFVFTGDWNADGADDLLWRGVFATPNAGESLVFFPNDGTGVFSYGWRVRFLETTDPGGVMGDFDRDGHLDMVGPLDLLFGDGTLDDPMPSVANSISQQRAVDWEGDGDIDLVSSYIWVRTNDGTGDLDALNLTKPPTAPGNAYTPFAIGDVNNDGLQDFVAALVQQVPFVGNTLLDNRLLSVIANDTVIDLGSATPTPTQIPTRFSAHAPPVDVDGDGDLDLLEAGSLFAPGAPWLNDGTGFFSRSPNGYGSWAPTSATDLDGDGAVDLIATQSGMVGAMFQQPGGSWNPVVLISALGAVAEPTVADIDDDGDLDVATIISSSSNGGMLYVAENQGAGNFVVHVLPGHGIYGSGALALLADVDGDGRKDFILTGSSGGPCISCEFAVLRRLGPGFSNVAPVVRFRSPEHRNVFDADGDGDDDLYGALRVSSRRYRGASAGSIQQFSSGTPGNGGWTPVLGVAGPVRPGATAEIRIARALAGAPGVLVIGTNTGALPNTPLPGLTTYCTPWVAAIPVSIPVGIPSVGTGLLGIPVVLPASLANTSICLQAGVFDAVAVSGVAITNGTHVRFGW